MILPIVVIVGVFALGSFLIFYSLVSVGSRGDIDPEVFYRRNRRSS